MIEINDLRVTKESNTICVVSKLAAPAGQRIVITGNNGAGKSTLLRVLAGIERDYTGTCRVSVDQAKRVYVHQSPFLFRGTVLQNVAYGLRARGVSRSAAADVGRLLLTQLGIQSLMEADSRTLSGGEIRRIAIARAIAVQPSLLLLDEPFAELDEAGIAAVQALLDTLRDTTVLITTPKSLDGDLQDYQLLEL